jgi:hypothetical protein
MFMGQQSYSYKMDSENDTLKIFIGTEPRMWLAEAVLRFSICKFVTGPYEIISMDGTNGASMWRGWDIGRPPGQPATRDIRATGESVWFTDFTNFRWAIPEACNFSGKAIYVDVDEVFLRDPRELFTLPVPANKGALSLNEHETSVMLFNCEYFRGLTWWPSVDEMKINNRGISFYLSLLKNHDAFSPLPLCWNCLDGKGYEEGETALLHYTDMSTQIWRPYPERLQYRRHPCPDAEDCWMGLYYEAKMDSFLPAAPPPGGRYQEDNMVSFNKFILEYESEKTWLATIDSIDEPPEFSDCPYSNDNPSPRYLELLDLYQQMHCEGSLQLHIPAEQTFSGLSLRPHLSSIKSLIDLYQASTLLDYGSGKGEFYKPGATIALQDGTVIYDIKEYWGLTPLCYDPGYTPLSQWPTDTYDGVICTDVLEHCPEEDLPWIVDALFSFAKKFIFANIACYPALKILPNGENAHITLKPPSWWKHLIEGIADRHKQVHYYFFITLRFPLVNDSEIYCTKHEIIQGPPHCLRVIS